MRKLVTVAAGPKKPPKNAESNKAKASAEQLKLMVSILKKLGVNCKDGKHGTSLDGVFWLGETRNGGLMLVGGEDGFTGDEEFGYEITEHFEQEANLPVDKSLEKTFTALAKDIVKEIKESPVETSDVAGWFCVLNKRKSVALVHVTESTNFVYYDGKVIEKRNTVSQIAKNLGGTGTMKLRNDEDVLLYITKMLEK